MKKTLREQVRTINDSKLLDDVLEKVFAAGSVTEAQEVIKQAF